MTSLAQPSEGSCIRHVGSFHELATTPLTHGVNALCWDRLLPGDYAEVVLVLGDGNSPRFRVTCTATNRFRVEPFWNRRHGIPPLPPGIVSF